MGKSCTTCSWRNTSQWPELVGFPNVLAELVQAECLTRAVVDRLPYARLCYYSLTPAFQQSLTRWISTSEIAQRMLREGSARTHRPDRSSAQSYGSQRICGHAAAAIASQGIASWWSAGTFMRSTGVLGRG